MVNIPINWAESIFEPFWDTGESYKEHGKYNRLTDYSINAGGNTAEIRTAWNGVNVIIEKQDSPDPVVLERDCQLSVQGYEVCRLFAAVPKAIAFRILGRVDGKERILLEANGNDTTGEYDGSLNGKLITHIRLEFRKKGEGPGVVTLYWLGLANAAKQAELDAGVSPYDDSWEGCFSEGFEIKPALGLYFDEEELEKLRLKIKKPPFNSVADKLREEANKDMELNPEALIGTYLPHPDRRWVRDREMKHPSLSAPMERLAFIGLLEKNPAMLKMACRMALSTAHCQYWCESIIGVFPGATWHHRSFTEEEICRSVALVLDWAGTLLTWHGKNILYDAIIQKGLPRIESDFKTVEYIRHMNQGIVFSSGRIIALMALSRRYPRYESWLLDAEKDLREMVDAYIGSDGGTLEGPGYWSYTFRHTLPLVYILARHHGMALKDYAWDKLRLTSAYALAMVSEVGGGIRHLPVNDAHQSVFPPVVAALFVRMLGDTPWKRIYSRLIKELPESVDKDFLIMAPEGFMEEEPEDRPVMEDGFICLNETGQTALRRPSPLGRIHLHLVSGPNYFAHSHGDKGSIILEADGKPLLIDRGACTYNNPYIGTIGKSSVHNLFYPETPQGRSFSQRPESCGGGRLVRSQYTEGHLFYETDLTDAWEAGIFKKCLRRVHSSYPLLYAVEDEVLFERPTASSFRLNTYGRIEKKANYWTIREGDIQLAVYPVKDVPCKDVYGEEGWDAELRTVSQLRLYIEKREAVSLLTLLEISRPGEEKLVIKPGGKLFYNDAPLNIP